ncbi:MAG: hypothetical protein QOJ32_3402 [Frankiaceae bacterium]|jgi:GAF domain-containing protein|nr:hypothetical protein [Frankiaceae bacterium]
MDAADTPRLDDPQPDDARLDDTELEAALGGLSGLVAGHDPLEITLRRIAEFAARAIPAADGAGLTLLGDGQRRTVVATDDLVHAVDDVQYSLEEGPCLRAMELGATVVSGSLSGDPTYPRFGPRVGRMGVHSSLSLPLLLEDEVIGALNVYARAKDAFGDEAARLGELFARPAAVSVRNAQMLADLQRTVEQLRTALASRAGIDQAVGLLMSRSGLTAAEAFQRLREMSQRSHVRVGVIAQQLLDEAVTRARVRRSGDDATERVEQPRAGDRR